MSRRGFTLIELLVIIGIMATMVTVGLVSVNRGQGSARVKGATRDVFAAIRHARSTALVTGKPAVVTYSTDFTEGEPVAKIEINSAKLFTQSSSRGELQTLSGEPLPDAPKELVHIEDKRKDVAPDSADETTDKGGESIEDILFEPVNVEVVKGIRIKAIKEDDVEESGSRKTRISVFSNVDYLLSKFKSSKENKKNSEDEEKTTETTKETDEPLSIVWEANGRVDPHRVWVYADGQKPEDGLVIKIDRFGAAKVLSGNDREDD